MATSIEDKKKSRVKKLISAEKELFINHFNEDPLSVPVPELASKLKSQNLSLKDFRNFYDKYPYLNLLPSFIDGSITDLDLSLFNGEIRLGQKLLYFITRFKNIKITNKSVSKDGEKIELTCYAESKSMDKEIIALVCKFQDDKLVAFEDKIDKVETHTLYQINNTLEEFDEYTYLTTSETLGLIELNGLSKELEGGKLADFIIKAFESKKNKTHFESTLDALISLEIVQSVKGDKLSKVINKDYPFQYFITKLTSLNPDVLSSLPIKKLVNSLLETTFCELENIYNEYKDLINNAIYYDLDGTSVLISQIPKNDILKKANLSKRLSKYTVDVERGSGHFRYTEKASVHNMNEIIDFSIEQLNDFIEQIEKLSVLEISNDEIQSSKNKLNQYKTHFSELKVASKIRASSFTKKGKLGKILYIVAIVFIVSFVVRNCS